MNVETLETLSMVFFIAAGVLLAVTVILFFVLHIPKMFGIATGLAASRGIREIQKRSENSAPVKNSPKPRMEISQPAVQEKIQSAKAVTTKMVPTTATTVLSPASQEKTVEKSLPVLYPDEVFSVIEEFCYTSSTEVIE